MGARIASVAVLCFAVGVSDARAMTFSVKEISPTVRVILAEGEISATDDLSALTQLSSQGLRTVVFNSPGGNTVKSIELGRLIRSLGLNTLQPRWLDCASACALAFLGGAERAAQPGALGVHKSSFSDDSSLNSDAAVSSIQSLTADLIGYLSEMGVDPALLRIAYSYESSDIRYLSGSEMAQLRVTSLAWSGRVNPEAQEVRQVTSSPTERRKQWRRDSSNNFGYIDPTTLPIPKSGQVRHPRGKAELLASSFAGARTLLILPNGKAVSIAGVYDDWYLVRVEGVSGFLHNTWVRVDQFASAEGDRRYIQIKSFRGILDAETFVNSSDLKLSAFLAANGMVAVTLKDPFPTAFAKQTLKELKNKGGVPSDSFVTYGNQYVRRLCCN